MNKTCVDVCSFCYRPEPRLSKLPTPAKMRAWERELITMSAKLGRQLHNADLSGMSPADRQDHKLAIAISELAGSLAPQEVWLICPACTEKGSKWIAKKSIEHMYASYYPVLSEDERRNIEKMLGDDLTGICAKSEDELVNNVPDESFLTPVRDMIKKRRLVSN